MQNYVIFLCLFLFSFSQCHEEPLPGFDFANYREILRGYLLGLTVKLGDLEKLIECTTDSKSIQNEFVHDIDVLRRTNFQNLPKMAEALASIFETLKLSMIEMETCVQGNIFYERLFDKVHRLMKVTAVKRLMLQFISNPQQMFKDVHDAINNYLVGKFRDSGRDLGEIMYLLITFAQPRSFPFNDYLKIVKGFLIGLNINKDLDNVLKCIEEVPESFNALIALMKKIKDWDFKDIEDVIDTLHQAFEKIKELLKSFEHCAESIPEFKALLEKLLDLDITKVLERLKENIFEIVESFIEANEAFENKEFEKFGTILGTVVFKLLLDPKLLAVQ